MVLSMWLIRVDSFIEPGRRGCDLCFGRLDGVAVDAVDGVGGDTVSWMKPPGPGLSGRGDPIVIVWLRGSPRCWMDVG